MPKGVKAMLARVRKLERSTENVGEYRAMVFALYEDAISDGRICPNDGPVLFKAVVNWIDEGLVRPN